MGLRPIPRQRGLFVKSPLWIPEKQRLTFIVWVSPTALKVSKGRRTRRLLAFGVAGLKAIGAFRLAPLRTDTWGSASYPAKGVFL